jgi:crotonobetainyl-CoA:carnitine CoA-transferase CaiB-like acyl-CoA transferase
MHRGESVYYSIYNRGKKAVTLDIWSDDGGDLLRRLVPSFDVVVENFRPGTMAKLGLDFATIQQLSPRTSLVSISGFGQTGEYSNRVAFCDTALAMSGYLHNSGDPDSPVHKTGVSLADRLAAMNGAIGAIAALYDQKLTGQGRWVDVCLMDSAFTLVELPLIGYLLTGTPPESAETRRSGTAPAGVFPATDGKIQISAASQSVWVRMAGAMGRPDLPKDPRFCSVTARRNRDNTLELERIVRDWTKTRSVHDLLEVLLAADVPVAPIRSIPEAADDPNLQRRGMVVPVQHPTLGEMFVPGRAIRFADGEPAEIRRAPTKGEHNDYVFTTLLGLEEHEVRALQARGVI